jgi:hypothetical protein
MSILPLTGMTNGNIPGVRVVRALRLIILPPSVILLLRYCGNLDVSQACWLRDTFVIFTNW